MMWFYLIVYGVAFGILSSIAVKNKNRDQAGWFFIGFLFGVFGLIAALIVGKLQSQESTPIADLQFDISKHSKKCPDCAEIIKLEAKVCRFCRRNFSDEEVADSILSAQKEFDQAKEAIQKIALSKGLSVDQWECPTCGIVNSVNSDSCYLCKTRKPIIVIQDKNVH